MSAPAPFGRRRSETAVSVRAAAPSLRPAEAAETATGVRVFRDEPEIYDSAPLRAEASDRLTVAPKRRWLAEPWRSFSIATSAGFAVSSWLLPPEVQEIMQFVMALLTAGGLYAGWRKSRDITFD